MRLGEDRLRLWDLDPTKWEGEEALQSDTAHAEALKAEGFTYYLTTHDYSAIDRNATKIDCYRRKLPEPPCNDLCLCTKCIIRMDKAGYANYVLPE